MIHRYTQEYELDCPVAVAVATYLDAEHYAYLHRKYQTEYEVVRVSGRDIIINEGWRFIGLRRRGECLTAYFPPAIFVNISRDWLMSTQTRLRYTSAPGDKTTSTLEVTLDMAWFLWPFRFMIQRALERLKWEKDQEDVAMIARRARLFGRGYIGDYLAPSQFMLHKSEFVRCFGG